MAADGSAVVSWLAQQMGARRDEFIAGLVLTTRLEIKLLDDDSRIVDLLYASITENVVAAIHFLEHGGAVDDVEAPSAALAYARALAQRDVALSALIRAYRIGHSRFVDEAMALLASQAATEQSLPAARELVHRAAAFIDHVCDQVGVAYERERDRWVSSRSGLRQHWVNLVLSGAGVDIGKAEEALEYRLDRGHVAAVMWPSDSVATRDAANVFENAGAVVGAALGATGPALMVPTDEREARFWWPTDGVDFASLHQSVADVDLSVRLAIGDVGHGVDGFRRSLREAEQAKAIALYGGPSLGRLVCHDEVAPIALMAANVRELQLFVRRTLGGLAADDERNRWLRETLREFLARNRSYAGTADAMFLHRNTIQYRVTQAMEACGASFDNSDRIVKIQIALLACRWMGKSVLTPPA
ncbi:CdaR family transcriptional regulator [Mycolicibacterium sp. CH28]|uniref:PucR family transcriptional regulator n=1 Tax=Mycolicibacterium sp. CH28 TaxID=2512237 RepID=UPI001F38F54B|nr:helix-turn-helix domain-containing protein [Mycolicibacterium sp. CH28]